ncbi:Acetyltransferase (GNAT) family protein [Burkholderia multivorans]
MADADLLAESNARLSTDEGHRIVRTFDEYRSRMCGWLSSSRHHAIVFERNDRFAAYALYEECDEYTCLRQFFVARDCRRQGIGAAAIDLLRSEVWDPARRLTVEVLVTNHVGIAFWHAVGYQDYLIGLEIMPGHHRGPSMRKTPAR